MRALRREKPCFDWNVDKIAVLRRLWDKGDSTAEIGRVLGCSKDAVIGKAHRLNLTPRRSPLLACDPKTTAKPQVKEKRVTSVGMAWLPLKGATLPALATAPIVKAEPDQQPRYLGRVTECKFPVRGSGRFTVYCEKATLPGRSYCGDHHLVCIDKNAREATPAAVANMVHRPKSTWTDARTLEEV